jgi:hypothetical protein
MRPDFRAHGTGQNRLDANVGVPELRGERKRQE